MAANEEVLPISYLYLMCYMFCPSYQPWFIHFNNMCLSVSQINCPFYQASKQLQT